MRLFKSHPLLKLVNSYVIDSPTPSNISYFWNFGSLLGFCLIIQIVTGVTLAMHYDPSTIQAFNSVEHVMRDVNNGWLIRYLHSNTASAFFFLVYIHIGRGLYYGSYKAPRTLVWTIGTVIFILMVAIAFLGYVLPYGQMSLWGATVITNLMSAIPWVGQDIVEFIWGGFSVNNATLNRFFALHFVLPFVLAALVVMHLASLHNSAGSSNPLGVSANYDRLPFAPYFVFKDLITFFLFILVLILFVFFMPNILGDSENYVVANPMQTPPAIVPEWYLLPFYAILRSIPDKLLGVIAMFSAIIILLAMPFADLSRSSSNQFRPLSKTAFFIFAANFLILMQLGAKHVESPFIEYGQISTAIYFSYFLVLVPVISLLENTLIRFPKVEIEIFYSFAINPILQSGFSFNWSQFKTKLMERLTLRWGLILLTCISVSFWLKRLAELYPVNSDNIYELIATYGLIGAIILILRTILESLDYNDSNTLKMNVNPESVTTSEPLEYKNSNTLKMNVDPESGTTSESRWRAGSELRVESESGSGSGSVSVSGSDPGSTTLPIRVHTVEVDLALKQVGLNKDTFTNYLRQYGAPYNYKDVDAKSVRADILADRSTVPGLCVKIPSSVGQKLLDNENACLVAEMNLRGNHNPPIPGKSKEESLKILGAFKDEFDSAFRKNNFKIYTETPDPSNPFYYPQR